MVELFLKIVCYKLISAITGESLAVDKRSGDSCYSSSTVKTGEAFMIVTATGDSTFVGESCFG